MNQAPKFQSVVKIIRILVRTVLLFLTSGFFIFALLSGSEGYGGGFMGIIKNSPNALPWLLLFIINFAAWKWERVGGIILLLFSLAAFFFFRVYDGSRPGSFLVLFSICIPLFVIGMILIFCGMYQNSEKSRLTEIKVNDPLPDASSE